MRYVLISLKYRHQFLCDEKMAYAVMFLLVSRSQFRDHDKVMVIIASKKVKFLVHLV